MVNAQILRRAVRFGLVGLFITGVHIVVAASAISVFVAGPALANAVAFIVATAMSYLMNTLWSFSSTIHGVTLARFLAVSAVGCGAAVVVAWLADRRGLHHMHGILLVALIVPPLTFTLHNFWTYRARRDQSA